MLNLETMEHRDGVAWWEAPKPRRLFHRHRWQTKCFDTSHGGHWLERCACGATQFSDIPGWINEKKPRWR